MTQSNHTPTLDYFVGNANGRGLIRIEIEGTGEHIASMPRGRTSEEWAAKITHRYNAHDALVAALEGVIRVADRKTVEFDAAHAALAATKQFTASQYAKEGA
jgi:hypothetical protein